MLSMLLLCTSCGDADLFDTDKWTNEIEGWEPGVSLKVLQGSFTLWDLINQGDDDVVVKEENDLIIQYTEEGIYHIDIDQVFDMLLLIYRCLWIFRVQEYRCLVISL